MTLEELKERLKEQINESIAQLEDNPHFNNLREKYQNLSTGAQKGITLGFYALLALLVLSVPYSYFSSASDILAEFEEKRALVRGLLKAGRLAQAGGEVPRGPDKGGLQEMVNNLVRTSGLMEDQITPPTDFDIQEARGMALPGFRMEPCLITLKQLNISQAMDIGYRLQTLHPNIKLTGLEITASAKNDHYFDVAYKLISYIPPEPKAEE